MHDLRQQGETVLDGLRALPGGAELLELASRRRGRRARRRGRARPAARAHARASSTWSWPLTRSRSRVSWPGARHLRRAGRCGELAGSVHERFGTALLALARRTDRHRRAARRVLPAPGALPEVRSGSSEEDLRAATSPSTRSPSRSAARAGRAVGRAEHALEDLAAARLRVLHERSFIDDPTRLLRLARYRRASASSRAAHRRARRRGARGRRAVQRSPRARIGAELRLALAEADAPAALGDRWASSACSRALHPRCASTATLARRALALLPEDGRRDCCCWRRSAAAHDDAAPTRTPSARVSTARRARVHGRRPRPRDRDSALARRSSSGARATPARPRSCARRCARAHPRGVALAGCAGRGAAAHARPPSTRPRVARELRHVRLQISGDDLLAAGIPAGPGDRAAAGARAGAQARRRARRRARGGAERGAGGPVTAR